MINMVILSIVLPLLLYKIKTDSLTDKIAVVIIWFIVTISIHGFSYIMILSETLFLVTVIMTIIPFITVCVKKAINKSVKIEDDEYNVNVDDDIDVVESKENVDDIKEKNAEYKDNIESEKEDIATAQSIETQSAE